MLPTPPPGAAVPLCAAAVDLIIAAEVTDRRTYERLYARPTWPGGASGIMIGVGWDAAHNDRSDLIARGDPTAVPDQFRAMKRLWPDMGGLRKRRDDEAVLWVRGRAPVIDWGAPLGQGAKGRAVEVLQQALAARLLRQPDRR